MEKGRILQQGNEYIKFGFQMCQKELLQQIKEVVVMHILCVLNIK